MMPVLFITDGLILLLLTMVLMFVYYARRQEHLRAPWRIVARNPMAMASTVILFFLSFYWFNRFNPFSSRFGEYA